MKNSISPPTSAGPDALGLLRRRAAFDFFARKVLIRALAAREGGRKGRPMDAMDEVVRLERMLR